MSVVTGQWDFQKKQSNVLLTVSFQRSFKGYISLIAGSIYNTNLSFQGPSKIERRLLVKVNTIWAWIAYYVNEPHSTSLLCVPLSLLLSGNSILFLTNPRNGNYYHNGRSFCFFDNKGIIAQCKTNLLLWKRYIYKVLCLWKRRICMTKQHIASWYNYYSRLKYQTQEFYSWT